WPCPGKCAYCPSEFDVPKSYLSNEPAVMRAIRNKYNPYEQVRSRLLTLVANGHQPEKIELIVIGGTWSVLPRSYKFWFIKECFRAANEFGSHSAQRVTRNAKEKNISSLKNNLAREQKRNEKAKYKIIGITLETRPDYINEKELIEMRELGATRVELGVQAIDDKILEKNQRGHGVAEVVRATALLRAFGFKITYHLMPGLPGASAKKDLAMFKKIFSDERFRPDQIKFYPTVVTRGSQLYRWWRSGQYRPYADKVLANLIIACKKITPRYVRIIRLIRDIPAESIVAGNLVTNLRQVMKQRGVKCQCIRCRECRGQKVEESNLRLNIIKYPAAGGEEYFISWDSRDGRTLFGFCRLRLPGIVIARSPAPVSETGAGRRSNPAGSDKNEIASRGARNDKYVFLNNSALVRELHVYGELVPVGNKKKTQHAGLGKRLLDQAEQIARRNGFKKIAVISGIGARDYYRKLGYRPLANYLVKKLN
ncbi:MAG TPA: tRNA uridine(34) 5-carboxymethylaminomethyl modification radical SAM/GNAT enzyme Elp3, partial [Candidatus Methylomirabilis sp.]|nr:tRNA uridine(34) 5-carboxymethylaminomethyl modification radical SAM/GNAT enzyme Elp3 [Candidatus Methylomirabilis sp.]